MDAISSEDRQKKRALIVMTLLRVAIGWHFLYEGLSKLFNPVWSAAGYLQSATGPLAGLFHAMAAGEGTLALINILNPKLSIFFLALLPPFLSGDATTATVEMFGLGAVFMLMTFAVFGLYGVFAAAARDRLLASARVMKWLNRSFAAIFAALGARLAMEQA